MTTDRDIGGTRRSGRKARAARWCACVPAALALALTAACGGSKEQPATAEPDRSLPDTLRVATLYSPASYFIYRDTEMGYDYSLVSALASEKGMVLELEVAPSLAEAIARLDSGYVDLVAYEVPVTSEYKERVIHCGPVNTTSQVLVQPRRGGELITDVTELVGRDVYVEDGSKYLQRMRNLDEELGGGISIHTVNRDTLITEDLIGMVSDGEIPLTVVDSDIARINKTYYPDLDITLEVGFPQRSAWAVSKERAWLADSIDSWIQADKPREENAQLLKRYFELSKQVQPGVYNLDLRGGRVSPYDDLFRKYTAGSGADWRLLAAQGYIESKFNNDVVSWAGARGLMQIMPSTARAYHVDPESLPQPEVSIELGARIMKELDRSLQSRVPDEAERSKFVIAAYNSGLAHIYDAIELARKTGRNPQVWYGNVEDALMLKSNPEYYNDPVCRHGYFRGRQTIDYVHEVMDLYDRITRSIDR